MPNDVTPTRRQLVYDRDQMRCRYCGRDVLLESVGQRRATIDHVVPSNRFKRENGGPGRGAANTLENMVTACFLCNHTKGDRTPEEAGMTLLPAPEGEIAVRTKVPQPKKAKTGRKYEVVAPPPRMTYRIRLPERDSAGNLFLGPEHEVPADSRQVVYPSGARLNLPLR